METFDFLLTYCRSHYREEEYPALLVQIREWKKTHPLQNVRILDGTPLYTNTLMKYVPLLLAGAKLTVGIHPDIPYDPHLPDLLNQWGIPCTQNPGTDEYDCILDCGGVHSNLMPKIGFAELTRSGAYHFDGIDKPVILVDDSRIKAIETCLGTGDGFLRGMRENGYRDFRGKKILIFGYGKVGRGVAFYAMREGAEVTVADKTVSVHNPGLRFISVSDRAALAAAVRNAWCVVTCTGIRNAMCGNGTAEELRKGKQLIAAMGIENEWGDELPPDRILNHGMPLNFCLPEPTQLRYIDPTMALSNAAALELCTKKYPSGLCKIAPETEQKYWKIIETESLIRDEVKGAEL